jgi:hypothetical protein
MFWITHKGTELSVSEHLIEGRPIFHIIFPSGKPLIITRTENSQQQRFWTSVPEGRLQEAEEIGKLIEEHIVKPH